MNVRQWIVISGVVLSLFFPGCRAYERRELDLNEYAKFWGGADLEVESVAEFSQWLVSAGGGDEEQTFDFSDGFSWWEVEWFALVLNPDVRMARARAKVPLVGSREAGWWPDPSLEVEVLRFANRGRDSDFGLERGSFDGVNAGVLSGLANGLETTPPGYRRSAGDFVDDPWIVNASVRLTIPISGRLAAEKELRWREYESAHRRIVVEEWALITRVRRAWFEWSAAAQRLKLTHAYLDQLQAIAGMTDQLAAVGEMKPTDSRVLSIELRRRRAALLGLEGDEERKRFELLALMGFRPSAPIRFKPSMTVPWGQDELEPDDGQSKLIDRHPRIRLAAAAYEVADEAYRLEIRKQYPDLDLGPSFSLEEGFSRAGLGLGLPLPAWNRNRQGVAEAFEAREAARVEAEAVVQSVIGEWVRLRVDLDHASRRRAALFEEVVPVVDEQVADTRTLLDLGEVNVLLLRDALVASLETKLDLLDAELDRAVAAGTLVQMLDPLWATEQEQREVREEQE